MCGPTKAQLGEVRALTWAPGDADSALQNLLEVLMLRVLTLVMALGCWCAGNTALFALGSC